MKSRRFKKGFTLVELLVVIAILAVLAGVSVIGYLSFTSQARTSADEQAVTQMNIALEAQEAIDKPENVEEAKDVLEAAGFSVDDYVPLDKDNIFYYDNDEIRVLIFDQADKKVTFPQELAEKYSDVSAQIGTWALLNDKTYVWDEIPEESLSGDNTTNTNNFIDAVKSSTATTVIKLPCDANFVDTTKMGSTWYGPNSLSRYYFPLNSDGIVNVDLNGHTVSFNFEACFGGQKNYSNGTVQVGNVTISNGKIAFIGSRTFDIPRFVVGENSSLTLNNCEIVTELDRSAYSQFEVLDGGRLTISNCTLTAANGDTTNVFLAGNGSETNIFNSSLTCTSMGITSNASGSESWNLRLKVVNSTVVATEGAPVLVNVPGSYKFEDSSLKGNGLGVVIRGGDATIDGCDVEITGSNVNWKDAIGRGNEPVNEWEFSKISGFGDAKQDEEVPDNAFRWTNTDGSWGTGMGIQFGALIVGDWNSNSYGYDSSCKLSDTKVRMDDAWTDLPIVYLSQDSVTKDGVITPLTTDFVYDAPSCKFYLGADEVEGANAIVCNSQNGKTEAYSGTIIINGEKQPITYTPAN